MGAKDEVPMWVGRHAVLAPEDHDDLDARAAVEEFRNHHPRQVAEDRAHAAWLRERALDAAAHHLIGARAAHGAGDDAAAKQHGAAYAAAARHLGFNPAGEPPQDVLDRVQDVRPRVYRFKGHDADRFFPAETQEAAESDVALGDRLEKIRAMRTKLQGG